MAHHSSEPFEELPDGLKEAFKLRDSVQVFDQDPQFGPTGRFPQGHYTDQDEGEIQFGIAADEKAGKVIISFGKPIAWIGMDPSQAEELGRLLQEKAMIISDSKEK